MVNGAESEEDEVDCNVSQGSVLGLSMFGDYSFPVEDIFNLHGVSFHFYADDIQIYVSCSVGEEAEALKRLDLFIHEVQIWMAQNYLNLNDDKPDYIILGSKNSLQKVCAIPITIGDSKIQPSAQYWGYIDKLMKLADSVGTVEVTQCSIFKICSFDNQPLLSTHQFRPSSGGDLNTF